MATIATESEVKSEVDSERSRRFFLSSLLPNARTNTHAERLRLYRLFQFAIAILLFKVLLSILIEYRNYFPANFDSAFLSGRRYSFVGWYRASFYVHIITGPIAILLAAFLIVSSGFPRSRRAHRIAGRTLAILVTVVLLPSSLLMASQAYAGPIAEWGFSVLAVMTTVTCLMAGFQARARNFVSHQRWAMRCFLMLCSPLLLRLMSGAAIVTGWESDLTYRLNAWLSWLVPLLAYQAWLHVNPRFEIALPHKDPK
jgi:hypothetical protein